MFPISWTVDCRKEMDFKWGGGGGGAVGAVGERVGSSNNKFKEIKLSPLLNTIP